MAVLPNVLRADADGACGGSWQGRGRVSYGIELWGSLVPPFRHLTTNTSRLAGAQPREGATGTWAPHGQPGGRCPPAPGGLAKTSLRALPGSLGPYGVPWIALRRPRRRRFLSRSALRLPAGVRPSGSHAMECGAIQPLGSRRLPAIAGASPSAFVPGLLELGAPTRTPTFQAPALATLGAGTERPVASKDAEIVGMGRGGGDNSVLHDDVVALQLR